MKAIFKRTITKEEAQEILREIEPDEISDYYASANSWKNDNGTLAAITTTTSGGTYIAIAIKITDEKGYMSVAHEGARSSQPTMIWELMPESFYKFRDIKGWDLATYKTSEKDWSPVCGILLGKYWEGCPETAREADWIDSQKQEQELERKLLKAGIKKDIHYSTEDGCFYEIGETSLIPLILTSKEQKRLSAVGEKI